MNTESRTYINSFIHPGIHFSFIYSPEMGQKLAQIQIENCAKSPLLV